MLGIWEEDPKLITVLYVQVTQSIGWVKKFYTPKVFLYIIL